jgi:hypothetical protein
MQRTQSRRNPRKGISDQGASEFAAEPLERAEAAHVARNSALSATPARLLRLDQGLYAVEIGETTARDGEISGLMLPVVLISAPPGNRDEPVENQHLQRRRLVARTGWGYGHCQVALWRWTPVGRGLRPT